MKVIELRIKETEQPLNSMRQDIVEHWLDGEEWYTTISIYVRKVK